MKDTAIASTGAMVAAGIIPIASSDADGSEQVVNWHKDIYRQLLIDNQTFGSYEKVFRNFDVDAAAQIYEEMGFQKVCYFAKCAAGYSYYPTKIGVQHPGLEWDFTGEMTRALKKRGIRCIAYYYMSQERELQKEHPDWVSTQEFSDWNPNDIKNTEVVAMCHNSPYMKQVIIPQMKEIVDLYDVDGFFLDIVLQQYFQMNCYCPCCRDLYEKEIGGKLPTDASDPNVYALRRLKNKILETLMDDYNRELMAQKPELAIITNYAWMTRYPVTPPKYIQHITWDTPTPKHGNYSWNFSFEGRYLATLTDVLPDVTWSVMSIDSVDWNQYSFREPETFFQESATLLATCGRTYLSHTLYPNANPEPAILEVYGDVNRWIKELEPYVKDCRPVKDVAVLHSADSVWSREPFLPSPTWVAGPAYYPVTGAHSALTEGHVQMSIVNSDVLVETIDGYGAVILPDQRMLSNRESEAIRRYVRNGGMLIATGETGTRDGDNNLLKDNFDLADVLGVDLVAPRTDAYCYLRTKSKKMPHGIPSMDIFTGTTYVEVKATTAQTLLELVPAYEGKIAPAEAPSGPGVTINSYGKGKAIYCSPHLFYKFMEDNTPVLRNLVLWMLDQVYPEKARAIACENTPAMVEVFYNQRSNERFVHLVNYAGNKRENGTPQVQDLPTVHGIRVHVRLDAKPVSIQSVPDGKSIDFSYRSGRITFEAEPLKIHGVYRIEV
ncbi:beta-galactosidase trimerization domain-containing protein [Candidatus Latescibacterota bacterium]